MSTPDPLLPAQRLIAEGRHQSAIDELTRVLAVDADSVAGHFLLAMAYQSMDNLGACLKHYRRTLELNPRHENAYNNMGGAYQHQGRLDVAVACYRNALAIKRDFPEALNNLGGALQLQGGLDESIVHYQRALALRPYYPDANSSLLMALAGHAKVSPIEYLRHARQYGGKMLALAKPFASWPAVPASTNRTRLRVGLVSGELRMNPVGYFLESTLAHLDPARIELLAFCTDRREDALTARVKPLFAEWHSIVGLGDEAAAHTIHSAAPHILVDLAGHTVNNRLPVFAWKPAPVQASWLGYFASTGVPGMDYVIADPSPAAEENRDDFSEQMWRLPDTRFCFTAPDAAPAATPLPALRNGYVTFGSFQRLTKLNDTVLATWGGILRALPTARLRLQMIEMRWPEARNQLLKRLEAFGIAQSRVTVLAKVPRDSYFAAHAEIDIMLDTFPFPGGTTTCEALWMGVPTLTLTGTTMLARQGASLLRAAGLQDWIADSAHDYVSRAIAHASATGALADLRRQLRLRVAASPLFDAPRFARHLETALYGMWEHYALRDCK